MKIKVKVGDKLELNLDKIRDSTITYGGDQGDWESLNDAVVIGIMGNEIHYKTIDNTQDWFNVFCLEEGLVSIKTLKKKASKKKLDTQRKKIIKEIKGNPVFAKQFKNIKKDVESWSDEQILNWFK